MTIDERKRINSQVMDTVRALGDREARCIWNIASRLLIGQSLYGELSPGKKNWKKEAKEEAIDMAVYLAALLEDDNALP